MKLNINTLIQATVLSVLFLATSIEASGAANSGGQHDSSGPGLHDSTNPGSISLIYN